jgi:hypothetical protein
VRGYRSAANLAITLKYGDIAPCEDLNFWGRAKCSHGARPGRTTLSIYAASISAVIFFGELRLRVHKVVELRRHP